MVVRVNRGPGSEAPDARNRDLSDPAAAGAEGSAGPETNGFALASLLLGIFWLFGLGSVAAIYLGIRALNQIQRAEGQQTGGALAWGGICAGIFGLFSVGLVIAVAVKA